MKVVIHLARTEPPEGTISVRGHEPTDDDEPNVRFAGWLGLVTCLYDLLGQGRDVDGSTRARPG